MNFIENKYINKTLKQGEGQLYATLQGPVNLFV